MRQAQQREVEKLQGFIDKFSAGTRAASAQSRKKQLEKMDLLAAPEGLDSGQAPRPPY
jgi:ATPase subunit of ABC transporter with duplicated ATPase domains